jgi:hypothetical protein
MAGFGAHDRRHGGRLERQVWLGAVGVARRYAEVDPTDREIERSQARLGALLGLADQQATEAPVEKPPSQPGVKRAIGRPRIEGARPWDEAGISRAEWFRRRKAGR